VANCGLDNVDENILDVTLSHVRSTVQCTC